MAAGLVLLVLAWPIRRETAASSRALATDSVVVRFVLYAPGARAVSVAGSFNQWDRGATPLVPAGRSGVWATTVTLAPGQHQYAFVVDGRQWVVDPGAPAVDDGFGRRNSVITVGAPAGRRSL
jgi:1,4-alpha-glucan branching enzyme